MDNFKNPFITSGYAEPEYFCAREKESHDFVNLITSGNNLTIISPRQMGKTAFILHCFNKPEIQNQHNVFLIDVYATKNFNEFIYKLAKGVFESISHNPEWVEIYFSVVTSLQHPLHYNKQPKGIVFNIGVGEIREPLRTLEEVFYFFEAMDKPCVVALDEFQTITGYPENEAEKILHSLIQHCKNTTFIYSGSQSKIMNDLFLTPSRPFFQSTILLNFNTINKQKYVDFVLNHFQSRGKNIANEAIEFVYDLFEGHTWYLQTIFNELYASTERGEHCSMHLIKETIKNKIASFEPLYQCIMVLLTERQTELLCAVARESKAKLITSGEFIRKHALASSSSVQAAAKQLMEKDIITFHDKTYQISDRFFSFWLAKNYGPGFTI